MPAAESSQPMLDILFAGDSDRRFTRPAEVLTPVTVADAERALKRIDEAHRAGYAIAGFVDFEFGYACCGLANPYEMTMPERPLMRIGLYAPDDVRPGETGLPASSRDDVVQFASAVSPAEYAAAIGEIGARLFAGDVYQINYTVPFFGRLADEFGHESALHIFRQIGGASHAPYRAIVQYEGGSLVSISPELFLRITAETLETKPMKGTAAPADESVLHSAKNRAEHVMIVDLLRNDLARVCDAVEVPALFSVERYPTFSTMTSTIRGRRRPDAGFAAILHALFPCGSVVGAPKIAALRTIGELECRPRGAYCGTVGYLLPDGTGMWNVAIRTLQFDYAHREARLDVGGGIVADSTAAGEWQELLLKAAFLQPFGTIA